MLVTDAVAGPGTNHPPEAGLDFLWLELTGKCNLACVHCYADSSPLLPLFGGMELSDWKRVLCDSYELGCRKVQFIGGEPTIYPHLIELIEHARGLGYELVEVFTNGNAFTQRIKDAFQRFRVHLAFSVYADSASIHDGITLVPGSFSKTVQSIRWALASGLEVRVAIVESDRNSSVVEAARSFFAELGVGGVHVDGIRGVGRGAQDGNCESAMDALCGNCWQGKLCVTANGDMFPCVFSRAWIVGTAAEGIKPVVEGQRLSEFRSALKSRLLNDPVASDFPSEEDPERPTCNPDKAPCIPARVRQDLMEANPTSKPPCGPSKAKSCAPVREFSSADSVAAQG